jgi:metallo-beta-lactamase class B
MNRYRLLSAAFLSAFSSLALAQSDPVSRSWNQPVEPFRVIGNIYYVGASDITSFLIQTSQGLILVDGGFAETAPLIRKNVEQLGFKMSDVRFLLNSHAHLDHAGGLAALKHLSGARMAASEADAPLLERGGHGDPQFGDSLTFPPVHVDRVVHDGDTIELGGIVLHAMATPGHTPGCTTWTMQAAEEGKKYNVVFFCSTSVPSQYRLVDNKAYPGVVADYEHTFVRLQSLPCDVFLAPHGSFIRLEEKIRERQAHPDANPFIDPEGWKRYLERSAQEFHEKLKQQTADAQRR